MTTLTSLGLATDLSLTLRQGGLVEEHDDYLVVRTPANPTYHWGNCLILRTAPAPGTLATWLEVFRREHPGATHVAVAIDADVDLDADEAASLSVEVEHDTVLVSDAPLAAPAADGVRLIHVDPADDPAWERLVEMEMADEIVGTPEAHRLFLQRRYAGHRALIEAGAGSWCAAVLPDDTPVATLGVFAAGEGLARYQQVMTHPDHRRRGLAAALVGFAGEWALSELDATRLVIVADPEGPAIGLYRRAGFSDHQRQTALYRAG